MRIQPEEVISEHEPEDLASLEMPVLREWRERLQEVEYGFSYARRVTQGRLDTLMAELERRRSGDVDTDVVGSHRSNPEYRTFMSSRVATDTPDVPTFP